MPNRYYSEATAKKIRSCVNANPGIRAKEIGQRIGLTRSTVNSYLYSKKPGALGKYVYQDSNYGWHLKASVATKQVSSPTNQKSYSQPEPKSSLNRCVSVQVSLQEAFQGAKKTVSDGEDTIEFFIPARTRPGTKIQIPGKGKVNNATGARGDLFCWVNLRSESLLQLVGDDVVYNTTIDINLAIYGGQIEVPSVEGTLNVQIPAGIKQSGTQLRLKQKGWVTSSGERGNQYINLDIRASAKITEPTPTPEPSYSVDAIQEVFRSEDYTSLNDEEQGKLAEMLEKAELTQRKKQGLAETKKAGVLTVFTSGWFWLAIAIGSTATYGGLQLLPQFLSSPKAPVEKSK